MNNNTDQQSKKRLKYKIPIEKITASKIAKKEHCSINIVYKKIKAGEFGDYWKSPIRISLQEYIKRKSEVFKNVNTNNNSDEELSLNVKNIKTKENFKTAIFFDIITANVEYIKIKNMSDKKYYENIFYDIFKIMKEDPYIYKIDKIRFINIFISIKNLIYSLLGITKYESDRISIAKEYIKKASKVIKKIDMIKNDLSLLENIMKSDKKRISLNKGFRITGTFRQINKWLDDQKNCISELLNAFPRIKNGIFFKPEQHIEFQLLLKRLSGFKSRTIEKIIFEILLSTEHSYIKDWAGDHLKRIRSLIYREKLIAVNPEIESRLKNFITDNIVWLNKWLG